MQGRKKQTFKENALKATERQIKLCSRFRRYRWLSSQRGESNRGGSFFAVPSFFQKADLGSLTSIPLHQRDPKNLAQAMERRHLMNAYDQDLDMGFTQEVIPECHHLCLIFDNDEQRQKIVSEYLAAGVKHSNIVRYFADTTPPQTIRTWLMRKGIEVSKAEEKGSFAIITAENAYCPGGRLVPQEVIERAVARYAMAKEAGYSGSRVSGEMTWVLRDIPGADRFLEYEALLNTITETFPYIGRCQYDARLFDGATLFKVLQVHPYMIARGQIVRNPFYIKPSEFLAKRQGKE